MAPAAVSPLTLKVSLSSMPVATGAMTGIIPAVYRSRMIWTFISTGRPTKPSSGSSASHTIMSSSLPEMPTARPPASLIAWTMRLLTRPDSTISTTSTVSLVVTRLPRTKRLSMPRRPSRSLIIGPPPWQTTGFMPTCFISTTSRANSAIASSSPMAFPPNLTTTTAPE